MDKNAKRIELKLKSDNLKPLSGWQLQEFVNNISKGYSKLDLINELSKLLNEDEKPENIIIMNKSYEINNSYSYLKKLNEIDLNKSSGVEKFYNLGRPISMYPNEKMKKIEIIFNLYEKLFSFFRANKITPISKNKLNSYINLAFDKAIIEMQKDIKQITNSLKGFENKNLERLENALNEQIEIAKNNYSNYKKDEFRMNSFNKLCDKEFTNLNEEEKNLFITMDKKHYNKFFRCFRDIDRPIILLYDEKNNKLSVIKKEYMLNDIESENFLDYKDYSHNSPFVVTIIAGVTISLIASLLYSGVKQEKFNIEQECENSDLEEEINNEMKNIIENLANSEELNQVNNINNNFLKNKLFDVRARVQKNTKTTLKQKGVMNSNMVIKLEDYKETRQLDNNIKKEK